MDINNFYEPEQKQLEQYYQELASRTQWNPDNPTPIVLSIGTARVGSTASLNIFRGSMVVDSNDEIHSIPVAYQHFKAGLRHAMLNWQENSDWSFQVPTVPLFYMKDTIGPYTLKESEYNPLKVFEEMGYPKDKLFVNFLYRDPLDIFSSWVDKWGEIIPRQTLLDHFIVASNTLKNIHQDLEINNVESATLVYESIRDNKPDEVAESLFNRINQTFEKQGIIISSTENTTSNWNRLDREGWHPNQPQRYELAHVDKRVHQDARTKTSWSYRNKSSTELANYLLPDEVKQIENAGLLDTYDYFREETQSSLQLHVEGSTSLRDINEAYRSSNNEYPSYSSRK